jgi:hypothetical protein
MNIWSQDGPHQHNWKCETFIKEAKKWKELYETVGRGPTEDIAWVDLGRHWRTCQQCTVNSIAKRMEG